VDDPSALGSGASRTTYARFQAIVAEHSPQLRRVLLRVGVPQADLEDALQDTFLVRFSKNEEISSETERYYLIATALRVAANRRRGVRRRHQAYARYSSDVTTDGDEGDLDEHGDRVRAQHLVSEALGSLPRDLRDVLMLVELDELPVSAIAAQLGLPVGTTASRLRRARRAFEERIVEGRPSGAGDDSAVVFHWWSTREEQVALEAVLGLHHRGRPRTRVIGVHGGGVISAKSQLNTRMIWNQPPDVFQANLGLDLLDWVGAGKRRGSQLRSVAETLADDEWTAAFPRELIDAVSAGGQPYAVPLNIHRTNNLFYNRRLLDEHGLAPPSTLDGFFEVASRLKRRGVVPLAIGSRQPWPVTLLAFENLMISIAGPRYYKEFFSGQRSPSDPELRETLETLKRVLALANDDVQALTWDQAVDRMMTGSAAMNIMGDWVRGYLAARCSRPIEASDRAGLRLPVADDFAQIPTFGTEGVFVFTSDVFAIPTAARHPSEAAELLRTLGSSVGQVAFSLMKGSIPARVDADPSDFDPAARSTMRAFQSEHRVPTLTSLVPRVFALTLDSAMGSFVANRDVGETVRVINGHYADLAV
jgi:glucose/mannose transport system substrate-binding protein